MKEIDRSENGDLSRNQLEYWKQTMSVLMHFNDMCIRTRWFGMTVLTTLFAGATVVMAQQGDARIDVFGIAVQAPSILFGIATLVALALWHLDRNYYFKMLIASVEHAEAIEPRIRAATGQLIEGETLTVAISRKVSRSSAKAIPTWFYLAPATISFLLLVATFFRALPTNTLNAN